MFSIALFLAFVGEGCGAISKLLIIDLPHSPILVR